MVIKQSGHHGNWPAGFIEWTWWGHSQGEVDVACHVPVILVLVQHLGQETLMWMQSGRPANVKKVKVNWGHHVMPRSPAFKVSGKTIPEKPGQGFCLFLPTLLMTASWAKASSMVNQTPMSCALSATARLFSEMYLLASSLISTQLLSNAKSGAMGKAATKMVTKPNWSTARGQGNFKSYTQLTWPLASIGLVLKHAFARWQTPYGRDLEASLSEPWTQLSALAATCILCRAVSLSLLAELCPDFSMHNYQPLTLSKLSIHKQLHPLIVQCSVAG